MSKAIQYSLFIGLVVLNLSAALGSPTSAISQSESGEVELSSVSQIEKAFKDQSDHSNEIVWSESENGRQVEYRAVLNRAKGKKTKVRDPKTGDLVEAGEEEDGFNVTLEATAACDYCQGGSVRNSTMNPLFVKVSELNEIPKRLLPKKQDIASSLAAHLKASRERAEKIKNCEIVVKDNQDVPLKDGSRAKLDCLVSQIGKVSDEDGADLYADQVHGHIEDLLKSGNLTAAQHWIDKLKASATKNPMIKGKFDKLVTQLENRTNLNNLMALYRQRLVLDPTSPTYSQEVLKLKQDIGVSKAYFMARGLEVDKDVVAAIDALQLPTESVASTDPVKEQVDQIHREAVQRATGPVSGGGRMAPGTSKYGAPATTAPTQRPGAAPTQLPRGQQGLLGYGGRDPKTGRPIPGRPGR
ncbi:MAG: hypothetical protein AB7F86_18395 [Bdellovibrionales bacterium]